MKQRVNNYIFFRDIFLTILVICFILQDLLQEYIGLFRYLDEVVSISLLGIYIYGILYSKKAKKQEIQCLIMIILVTFIGISNNVMTGIQERNSAIMMDVINTFKFTFVFLGLTQINSKISNRKIIRNVSAFCKCYIVVLLVCAIINSFTDIGMYTGIRYGLKSFSFVYGIPGIVINHCTYIILVLIAETSVLKKNNKKYILITLIVILATLKSRGLGLIAMFCMLYYILLIKKKTNIRTYVFAIIIILGVIGMSQFEFYFIENTNAPRALFLLNAIKLAKKYFPLGTGFGTFGSFAAANYYSPLYYELGFSNKWGMGPSESLFLSDNYWPAILAQFGVIGFALFVILIIKYFKSLSTYIIKRNNSYTKLAFSFVTMDCLMSSIQSAYISHYSMIALIFILMIMFNNKEHYQSET